MKRLYNNKTGAQVNIGGTVAAPFVNFFGRKLFTLSGAITSGVTNKPVGSATGDFAITTNATGAGKWFYSDGTHLVQVSDSVGSQANFVAALTGAAGGTANGALENEGVVTTAGGNTYADAAVNSVTDKIKNNVAELAAEVESIRANLVAAGVMKSS